MTRRRASVTLTRLDCGNDVAPRDVGRFSDTFRYGDAKRTFTFSCYLIKHGNDYMVWDTGFMPASNPQLGGLTPALQTASSSP